VSFVNAKNDCNPAGTTGAVVPKMMRKKIAAKVKRKSKALIDKKSAVTKKKRKVAAKSKPIAKSLADKVAGTFTAVVDTLTDAERLHHKMEPEVSREPE
jgi:hypothetical protein